MTFYHSFIRPILFRFDPERIHQATLNACRTLGRSDVIRFGLRAMLTHDDPMLRSTVAGLEFPNPVGLAAGFDKNGWAVEALGSSGFGFVEIGSVSAYPSQGNPERPRLFRLPADEAIVVYYGVPNDGAGVIARRLASVQLPVPLGINLVETNTGRPADPAHVVSELVETVRPFIGLVDYIALNLNCPNTTGGVSPFDDPANLGMLLEGYQQYDRLSPVLLKLAPTIDPAHIDAVLATTDPFSFVKGFIFSLPPGRPYAGLKTPQAQLDRMPGSLCGRPAQRLATDAVRAWYARIDPARYALVGVGGIFSAEDAYEKIRLGASLVQLYTALIYHGPGLVKHINQGLCRLLERDGFRHITEAVGVDNPVRVS